MSVAYMSADVMEARALVQGLQRDACGDFLVPCNGRVERTQRADIAVLLATSDRAVRMNARRGATEVARQQARAALAHADAALDGPARRRACRAVALACRVLERAGPHRGAIARQHPLEPLTQRQRAAVNGQTNVQLCEAVGGLLGRELATRDRRLRALEERLILDTTQSRHRATAALRRAGVALA